jgi:FAD-linked oxidoreductase
MKNWGGNLYFNPKKILTPTNEKQIIQAILTAKKDNMSIRPIGSGHSWTHLFDTNEYLLNMDQYQGLTEIDQTSKLARFKAGTKMYTATNILLKHKLSLENQGDINLQSIAGALSTGTHGTGINLQSMSNQINALRLINARGEVVELVKDESELFNAYALSMGLLGIISEIEIEAVRQYCLEATVTKMSLNELIPIIKSAINDNRHFEIFYFAQGDWALVKKMNLTDKMPVKINLKQKIKNKFNDYLIENVLFDLVNKMAVVSHQYPQLDRFIQRFAGESSKVDFAQNIFPTYRNVRFMEMEYNVDLEDFDEVFDQVIKLAKSHSTKTLFPIEIRFVAADDLWLSPAYKRTSCYFAIHCYPGENYLDYFKAMEAIFKRFNGRPHWGKWHSLTQNELKKLYPKFDDFIQLRKTVDPNNLFIHQNNRLMI